MSVTPDQTRRPAARRPGRTRRYRFGYWAVAATYTALQAYMTVPSPLYGLYARRDHFSSLTITCVYAAYALGVVVSLILAGHLSDTYGRRPLLLTALTLAAASSVVFITWPALPGLYVARVVCGLAVGVTASTATAYLTELFLAHRPARLLHRAQLLATATATALGGLGIGGLAGGLLAQASRHPLVLPYAVMLAVLAACALAILAGPETRHPTRPRPAYHPQRLAVPRQAKSRFAAALGGVATQFAVFGLFVGLAGTFLTTTLHHDSLWLSGVTLCLVFTAGVACATITTSLAHRTLVALAITAMLTGLAALVTSAWLPRPSLTLFLIAGAITGAGGAALFKASLGVVVAISPPDRRAETLAGFFLAGYLGMSAPVIAIGITLQHASMRAALAGFAAVIAATLAITAPILTENRD